MCVCVCVRACVYRISPLNTRCLVHQGSLHRVQSMGARVHTALERLADTFAARNTKRRALGKWTRTTRDRTKARRLLLHWYMRLPAPRPR